VLTKLEDDHQALDRRKNWRIHLPPQEPGVKCMLMEGWQELSGIVAMDGESNQKRRDFWRTFSEDKTGKTLPTDFRDKEMLCAIAFVKRRFVRVFGKLDADIALDECHTLRLKGWHLNHSMPSTAYMAAVHWLKTLVSHASLGELQNLYDLAHAANAGREEWDTRIACLETALKHLPESEYEDARHAIALDAMIFYPTAHEAPARYGFNDEAKRVPGWLKRFWPETEPLLSPFYAVLLMDGDRLGQLLTELPESVIAQALDAFTREAEKIVFAHNGMLIYAGGDDVLALLPLENALACAAALSRAYADCFRSRCTLQAVHKATLSGAIIYAHVKSALSEVLRQAHEVLDEIAKDGSGRDAIAVRVLKPGGAHLTWAQPWEIALGDGILEVERIAKNFKSAGSEFSNRFFYKMRSRFETLEGMDTEEIAQLLAVDYMASEPGREVCPNIEAARDLMRPLLKQSCPVTRQIGAAPKQWPRAAATADAALLVRFLATLGVEP
jgi:CRISPR-associated protein Cmr2